MAKLKSQPLVDIQDLGMAKPVFKDIQPLSQLKEQGGSHICRRRMPSRGSLTRETTPSAVEISLQLW